MTKQANAQRLTALEASVPAQLGQVQRDMGKLESSVDRVETAVQAIQLRLAELRPRSPWPQLLAYTGLILPMYALVIDLIARGLG